jgi:hypothetical protein
VYTTHAHAYTHRFAEAGLPGCAKGDGTSSECTALLVFSLLDEYHNASSDLAPWMRSHSLSHSLSLSVTCVCHTHTHTHTHTRLFPRKLTSPLFWTEDEYEHLQGSNLYEICAGWEQSITNTYQKSIRALRARFLSPP